MFSIPGNVILKFILAHTALLLLAGVVLSLTSSAYAQESSTSPVSCELAPLELPLFGGTPVADAGIQAVRNMDMSRVDVSSDEVETILEQYVACTNTGDPTLIWAMFSPHWYAVTFANPQEHYLPAFEQMLDQPGADSEHPLELVTVDRVEKRPDGYVAVTATFRSGDMQWTDTLTLVMIDGEWLIDDVRLDTPVS